MQGRDEITASLETELRGSGEGILAAWLFGSVARDEAGPGSDVDVAVLLGRSPRSLAELPLDLEDHLERTLGLKVQVVALNEAPADLVHRVLLDGVLLLDRDPAARVRFEVQRRNEYFDLLPHLRRYRLLPEEAP
ncbi:MAG: nucleotidyltransferase domain-containing protein [Polyangia bacterium]|jgi:predicted nucleotidyltransferase|nr:nucleotidyltransferase domain-containing protein [Polyangia bacterium]